MVLSRYRIPGPTFLAESLLLELVVFLAGATAFFVVAFLVSAFLAAVGFVSFALVSFVFVAALVVAALVVVTGFLTVAALDVVAALCFFSRVGFLEVLAGLVSVFAEDLALVETGFAGLDSGLFCYQSKSRDSM